VYDMGRAFVRRSRLVACDAVVVMVCLQTQPLASTPELPTPLNLDILKMLTPLETLRVC
jgi:hypothetical protein